MTNLDFSAKPSLIDRLLNVVTEVRSGEGVTALLMGLNIFFLMASYYIIKPAREAFISVEDNGPALASYASGVMAVLLIPIVFGYGKLAQRAPRRWLITAVTSVFIVNLAIFFFWARSGVPYLGLAFFVWVGIFNVMVVAQFWAFGNDIYLPDQGKRLFPLIMLGQAFGAILGPQIAKWSVQRTGDTSFMLLIAAGLLGFCIAFTLIVDRRVRRKGERLPGQVAAQDQGGKPLGPEGGFELIRRHRYLMLLAALIMTLNLVNTTGEFILRTGAQDAGRQAAAVETSEPERITAQSNFVAGYYADFFSGVNLLTLLIQALLVSRILKYMGLRGALFILPAIAFVGYAAIALFPLLAVITVAKTAENSTDYSLMNTLRAALYLPTTREMKYKAKQAIDTFFVRAGDVISAGVVFVGSGLLQLGVRGFACIVFFVTIIWLILCRAIIVEYAAFEKRNPSR